MNKGEQFNLDGVDYCCLIDGIALTGDKIAWPGQKPIKVSTATKKKAVEKKTGQVVQDLFRNTDARDDNSEESAPRISVRESETVVSADDRWFLQINELNLAAYFSRGIIAPVAWQPENKAREQDLQALKPDALVLLPRVLTSKRYGTAAIEVALNDNERKAAGKWAFYYLSGSLPVSRVARVHFPSSAGTPANISGRYNYPDVFIPEVIIAADYERLPAVPESEEKGLVDEIMSCTYADADRQAVSGLAAYDRMLGSLAMMRTAGYFFTQKERMFWEYPNALTVALDALGIGTNAGKHASCPREVVAAIRHLLIGRGAEQPLLLALREVVLSGETLDFALSRDLARHHVKLMSSKPATEAFSLLFNEDDYKECVRILGQSRELLPCLALAYLYKFHKKDSHDPVNAFSWAGQDLVDDSTATYVLGLLGAYYGYARLRAFADVDDMDTAIEKAVGGSCLPVKFGPRNRLELLIMEHAHAWAFASYEPYDRPLDAVEGRRSALLPADVENLSSELCGNRVAIYRKVELADIVEEMIQRTYPPVICQFDYVLATCIAQYWPDLGCYPRLGPYNRDAVCTQINGLSRKQLARLKRHIEFDMEENQHG